MANTAQRNDVVAHARSGSRWTCSDLKSAMARLMGFIPEYGDTEFSFVVDGDDLYAFIRSPNEGHRIVSIASIKLGAPEDETPRHMLVSGLGPLAALREMINAELVRLPTNQGAASCFAGCAEKRPRSAR